AVNDPSFPFVFLVVSRPERIINEFFDSPASGLTLKLFLDDKYHPDSDIALFYSSSFAEIRRRYQIPDSWPTRAMMAQLRQVSGQFIYAATVVRFLQGHRQSPQAQLEVVLNWRPA